MSSWIYELTILSEMSLRALDYKGESMFKSMLINKDFLTWFVIGSCTASQSEPGLNIFDN